jgi:hypothetical protein
VDSLITAEDSLEESCGWSKSYSITHLSWTWRSVKKKIKEKKIQEKIRP